MRVKIEKERTREKEEVWQARSMTNAQKMKHNRFPHLAPKYHGLSTEEENKGPEMQMKTFQESGLTNTYRRVGESCSGLLGCKCGIQIQGRVSSQHTQMYYIQISLRH